MYQPTIIYFLFYNYLFIQEHQLRALQYLPDIIKLQRLLFEKFHRRLDRNEVEEYTLGIFFKRSKKIFQLLYLTLPKLSTLAAAN